MHTAELFIPALNGPSGHVYMSIWRLPPGTNTPMLASLPVSCPVCLHRGLLLHRKFNRISYAIKERSVPDPTAAKGDYIAHPKIIALYREPNYQAGFLLYQIKAYCQKLWIK